MTCVVALIRDLKSNVQLCQYSAHQFLSKYSIDDQCAIISVICIGRDHINHSQFIMSDEETIGYFGPSSPFSRYLFTGHGPSWRIRPEDFASMLSSKSDSIIMYCEAFIRCARNSHYDLHCF